MTLFEILESKQKRINFHKSEDYFYFEENRALIANLEMYRFLNLPKNEFDVIRANIVIRALKNKALLDDAIEYAYHASMMKTSDAMNFIHERMTGLPYIQEGDIKIYIPIFSKAINMLYYQDYGRLLKAPYNLLFTEFDSSCIDLFETYSFSLYDSMFTKFITVYRDDNILVVYHYDFRSLYIINDQGRLDAKIALFDKYMRKPVTNHIVERVKPVIQAYLNNDRDEMLSSLGNNGLISWRLINDIRRKDDKENKRKAKLVK